MREGAGTECAPGGTAVPSARVTWSAKVASNPCSSYLILVTNGQELLARITANKEIFGCRPIIRGMRISVELILSLLAQGETYDAILADYLDLQSEDIRACLAYAHAVIAHDSLDAVGVAGSEVPC